MKGARLICWAITYHSLVCGKTAKWLVNGERRCDTHAKLNSWQVERYGRVPIKAAMARAEGAGE